MALSSLLSPLLLLLAVLIHTASISPVYAQIDHASLQLMTEALEWPSTLSIQDEFSVIDASGDLDMSSTESDRRSMYWRTRRYYISYAALSANRIPCPARSGRSYYTHNCYRASGPVHPYTRGCSTITRCRS
ncbi:Protein RALF-like [Actinidia chinensis var. chinensis]|uniref:Protein RALF-like n=1 Tax=Actinidia chinensis var. chinensis TaxID=1590841 RepID=A0A2R6Q048_ACTCC|nr:protein RALF-like 34 [Actinidia eriantha]PSR99782.1 Protein RALF-like [Actinidia chinensis var. chinensis]